MKKFHENAKLASLTALFAVFLLSFTVSAYATSPPPGQGWTVENRNYNGNSSTLNLQATHAYVMGTDVADFNFLQALTGYTAYLWSNSYSSLTPGYTLQATFTISGSSPTFQYGPWGQSSSGSPAEVRLFFQSNLPVSSDNQAWCMPPGYGANNYWWSTTSYTITSTTSDVVLSALLAPSMWTNICGQSGTDPSLDFLGALSSVSHVGFSFGGDGAYARGVALTSGAATFELTGFSMSNTPFVQYWTANENGPFYRSVTPWSVSSPPLAAGDSLLETTGAGGISMAITDASNSYYDLGFYFTVGSLATLSTNPITITGTSFSVNLWINPQDWTWSGNKFTDLGSDGAYALGSGTGTQIVGPSSNFFITSAAAGSCLGAYVGQTQSVSTIQSECPTATFALWVGIVGPPSASGTVTSITT